MIGWLALGSGTRSLPKGIVEVWPVIGIRHQGVERIVAEIRGDRFHPYVPPTVSKPLGYLMPAHRWTTWAVDTSDGCANSMSAIGDLVNAVRHHGLSFMRRHGNLHGICALMEELPAWQPWFYRRPVAWLLAGDLARAQSSLQDALGRVGDADQGAVQEFRRFAALLEPGLAPGGRYHTPSAPYQDPWTLLPRAGSTWRRKLAKSVTAELRSRANSAGWKVSQGFLFREDRGWFVEARPHVWPALRRSTVTLHVKPMSIDPLFWEIVETKDDLEIIKEQPLSFRIFGVATVGTPPLCEIDVEEDSLDAAGLADSFLQVAEREFERWQPDRSLERLVSSAQEYWAKHPAAADNYLPAVVCGLTLLGRRNEARKACMAAREQKAWGDYVWVTDIRGTRARMARQDRARTPLTTWLSPAGRNPRSGIQRYGRQGGTSQRGSDRDCRIRSSLVPTFRVAQEANLSGAALFRRRSHSGRSGGLRAISRGCHPTPRPL